MTFVIHPCPTKSWPNTKSMAAPGLNVIALISGGKDSLFSILHCQAHGHVIVALANLYPANQITEGSESQQEVENEDIDSYMYQTVGHSIIPLYEKALGIPLYRQEITGQAVNSKRDYEQQEQDETEDLIPLLQRIVKEHPEANAISTGAILSTYQRTRVESVALRLGLTPLSYLWQYPLLPPHTQSSLLLDMAAVGQESVIIKTASGGLDETFLGLDVASHMTIAKLKKAMARFGEAGNGAIVGEGGEFETLALDGPRGLWKRRIRIGEVESVVVDGGQTVLRIKESSLEEKTGDREESGVLRIPELFDEEFKSILDDSDEQPLTTSGTATSTDLALVSEEISTSDNLPTNIYTITPTVFTYSNLSSASDASTTSPSRQLTNILLRVDHILKQCQLLKSNTNQCTLLLRNMSDFTVLNPVYAQYFDSINPPARVTIAAGSAMPDNIDVMLSVILDRTREDARQGLHVQSRSYWAPANIGPYSQAISVPLPSKAGNAGEIVYIAGQIPLVPASMEVYHEHGFKGQALLSLQHLWRIGRAKGVKWWTAGVGFIPASIADVDDAVRTAQDVWKQLHAPAAVQDEDENGHEDVDPWDRINSHAGTAFDDATHRAPIPAAIATATAPPCFVAQISSLPRAVDIEWSAMGLTCSSIHFSDNASAPTDSSSKFYALEIKEQRDVEKMKEKKWTSATLYAGRGFVWDGVGNGMQWIPCFRVWGNAGEEVCGVIVGRIDE
jgi:diphthine-ammonia ligase